MKHVLAAIAGSVVAVVVTTPALAATVTLEPTADSRVESARPTTNDGTDQFLMARLGTDRTYLRFNLSTVPAGATITGATLRVSPTCCANSPGLKSFRINPFAFSETDLDGTGPLQGINWNNQPGPIDPFISQSGSWTTIPTQVSLDVAPIVGQSRGDVNMMVGGAGTSTDAVVTFKSREHASGPGPKLDVTYSTSADTTPPDTTITSGPPASSTSTSQDFSFKSSESPSTFECRQDAGAWASCASPKGYTGLAVGSHTFAVRAIDQAGNVDPTPASQTSTITSASSSTGGRSLNIPFGGGNVNDANLSKAGSVMGIRFVLDKDTVMSKFVNQWKGKGATWDPHGAPFCSAPGSGCYGAGTGGKIRARLVTTKANGDPDLSHVLFEETFSPQKRYAETRSFFGITTLSLFYYTNTGNVSLKAGVPYAIVWNNVDANPNANFVSVNNVTVDRSVAGPHDKNTLDRNAPGAIAGLDPREATVWSSNSGSAWTYGWQVGQYFGNSNDVNGTRIPHYGYVKSDGTRVGIQPYSAYNVTCTGCTTHTVNTPNAVTITKGGGYAPDGSTVGTVTVRNVTTGVVGQTASLGGGMPVANLNKPVPVRVGDTVDFTASGTVYKAMADAFVGATFRSGVAGGDWPLTTASADDPAEVFGLPWPDYRHG